QPAVYGTNAGKGSGAAGEKRPQALDPDDRYRPLQEIQRPARARSGRPGASGSGLAPEPSHPEGRRGLPLRRRGIGAGLSGNRIGGSQGTGRQNTEIGQAAFDPPFKRDFGAGDGLGGGGGLPGRWEDGGRG